MKAYLLSMFDDFGLMRQFEVSREKMANFINIISQKYKPNEYHNFTHAFDVMQTVFVFLSDSNARSFLTSLDVFGLLVAAICHDVEHDGFTNAFHQNSRSNLAYIYNDKAILENHHASLCFNVAKQSDCDIFNSLDESQYREIRETIIQCILATDMAHHFDMVRILQLGQIMEVYWIEIIVMIAYFY